MTNDKKWTNQSILKIFFSKLESASSWQNTNKTDDRSGFTNYFLTGMKLYFCLFCFLSLSSYHAEGLVLQQAVLEFLKDRS